MTCVKPQCQTMSNSILYSLVFFVISHINYTLLFRQQLRHIFSEVPWRLQQLRTLQNPCEASDCYILNRLDIVADNYLNLSVLLSNGNGNNGNKDEKRSEDENKSVEEPEKERWTGIPDPPETTSRIPTYDEFARQRDSSRPPDSHYYTPTGPIKRSIGTRIQCDAIFTSSQFSLMLGYLL
ncbi:unnamed protein product [Chilo suppressalis]|uniref:Uncharacterized protein n=1 Tax=Chilo suppressalis TaxID=168631 RepID=A0ABN8L766_CHISP|nr:unnamed protein product [Chilo suppressalis]